jgi:predicted transcriptional regulator YdeE
LNVLARAEVQDIASYKFDKIPQRKNPGTTYCVYTDYDSNYTGAYTYFIGEEVLSLDDIPERLETLTIPSQNYIKFTTNPGPMPDVVKGTWQKIWEMSSKDLGGTRRYRADFEVYDKRASDHSKVVFDLFIGIE